MKIEDLLHHLKPGSQMNIHNKPFVFAGKAKITLDGGDVRYWLYEEDGGFLAVAPDAEELVLFHLLDEEIDPQGGMILHKGDEHEFSYEDAGVATGVDGGAAAEEGDRYSFSDYESDEGRVVRLITNENTGEIKAYEGTVVVEEDILASA
ncbi:MAG: hypothetical protein UY77_C0022G0001 [Candidatus Uhrbacteria bacterium GW2011_GWA2_53_10]|uniref:DUF4178 domain-containing protein n=1 Tax=Candidatus Uhrbacteria bacterium GW2011_GWA2_53_10 TaxID=1618980 RepID=A0A0G1XNN3_9BACT|nr:MAG: hypothetical protein UY77_C0022G0001 [Candidatus Uhrbacteria bacterium GW2011_GWA2_53_10]